MELTARECLIRLPHRYRAGIVDLTEPIAEEVRQCDLFLSDKNLCRQSLAPEGSKTVEMLAAVVV